MSDGYYVLNYLTGKWYKGDGTWTEYAISAYRYGSKESAETSEAFRRIQETKILKVEKVS